MLQCASIGGRRPDDECGPWVPKGKKNDPAREAEQRRRDGIDAEKRRERREKEREEAEKRNPKNNEPRVTGDRRGLWSEPPMDRRPSDNDAHSSPYNTLESAYENNDAVQQDIPYNNARPPSNYTYSMPYSTSASSYPRYASKTPYDSRL